MTGNEWMQHTMNEIVVLSEIEPTESLNSITCIDDLKTQLTDVIAFLIDKNFEKLLWILYRIDVDEEKAKQLLSKHLPEKAPEILAELIINRQQQKEEFRKQFHMEPDDTDDDLRL